ncbi:protein kinase domain-containing protein [Chamaesiphon sp. VAR_48_metabat_135_sub]|uniref:serine/threonine protein kinase n=1 Tax=Chamaesiphon sp. VAR_48_metabat_135_sub TaxID=2964699 RepID=UPI00286C7586|nr:protein kinase [Chamaesiphon sp. VAR_48_metabat_135_sub]
MLPLAPDTLLQQRYRILNLLGDGELGRIYLATDRGRGDASCAIEELIPAVKFPSTVAKAKEFFKHESTLLYQLQHLQIPRFWASFEEQNRVFLVRDYMPGKTYQDLLEERRDLGKAFSEAEVWQFLLQILPVVGYIHSKGAVHKAISPAHICCRDSDRLPVLIDFGVVKEFVNKLQGIPVIPPGSGGQSSYAPVEQIKSGQVYPNSDLYALAVTAMVLLTGKEPSALFQGDLINWDWRQWTQIGDEFANVLGRMSNLHPNDRYQSAIEVYRDLESLNIPNSPAPETARPQPFGASAIPTVVVGAKSIPSASNRIQTAITNFNAKSFWEKPQVFIPLGLLISLLASFGSWFVVSQLLHDRSPDPIPSTPPKQIDFDNPTIPDNTSTSSPTPTDTLQPDIDRPIVKEGTIDPKTPVRFRFAALAGQNLDIQLVAPIGQNAAPIDPSTPITTPISPISPNPSQKKDPKSNNNPPISPTPAATQVLMTITSPTGGPIDSQSERVVGWRGAIPVSGEYTIELRPIQGLTGKTFPYKLSITQISVIPSPSPLTPTTPETEATPSIGAPLPSGNGIKDLPSNPNPNLPSSNTPSISPDPIPIVVPKATPIESERPTRNIRRNRTEAEPNRQVRERERVKSSEEATPAPRRRNRVESSEAETPTPRRRRTRRTDSETQSQPSPSPKAAVEEKAIPIAVPEPQIGIPVPLPKSQTSPSKTDSDGTTPPSGSDATDPG